VLFMFISLIEVRHDIVTDSNGGKVLLPTPTVPGILYILPTG
jgi:hypothetical protein